MIVSHTRQPSPIRGVPVCDRAPARRQGHEAAVPICFVLQVASESPQINPTSQHSPRSSEWCCSGQDVMLQQWQDAKEALWGRGTLLSAAAVTCEHPRGAGWGSRKPCQPPTSAHPLCNLHGRWNLLLSQDEKCWPKARMVRRLWKRRKNRVSWLAL